MGLIEALGRVCCDLRLAFNEGRPQAGWVRPEDIAAHLRGDGSGVSSVRRFENGHGAKLWEEMLDAYAQELGVKVPDIYTKAFKRIAKPPRRAQTPSRNQASRRGSRRT